MKELTASELTHLAIAELTINRGCFVWRQNNIPVRGRKNSVKKGVSDIVGLSSTGVFLACEVKTKNDRLSQEQIEFLSTVQKRGGVSLLATVDEQGQFILKQFTQKQ